MKKFIIGLLTLVIPMKTSPNQERTSTQDVQIVSFQEHEPSFITADDGIKLAVYPFLSAEKPKDVVIFYHGAGFYSTKSYQSIGHTLIKNNSEIGCYFIDMRGHGRSDGERGDMPSNEQAFYDINTVIEYTRKQHPDARVFLAGHSAGSGLILNWITWQKHADVDGYIFIAPFLGSNSGTLLEGPQDPKKQFTKKVNIWAFIVYKFTFGLFGGHWKTLWFNHSEEKRKQNPLILDYYTLTMLLTISPNDAAAAFTAIDKPCVLAIGDQDERFDYKKVLERATSAQKSKDHIETVVLPSINHSSIIFKTANIIEQFTSRTRT